MDKNRKIILTAIKPTGSLTLGNYLGALKNLKAVVQANPDSELLIFIADLHATTLPIDPKELRENILRIAACYSALGFDKNHTHIFVQSEINEHAALGFLMESTAYFGELSRMIQFKEKAANSKNIRSSLFTYPALMAADILLYNADLVPIGEDQKQHMELTETLAKRFNKMYGETFKIPKYEINKHTRRIMSLQDPFTKMSKSSENPKSYILLSDSKDSILKKIKSAVTDSEAKIYFDIDKKPAISNLINIYAALTNLSIKDIETKYKDAKTYAKFKLDLAELLIHEIVPLGENIEKLVNSKELIETLVSGKKFAEKLAKENYAKAKKAVGLGYK